MSSLFLTEIDLLIFLNKVTYICFSNKRFHIFIYSYLLLYFAALNYYIYTGYTSSSPDTFTSGWFKTQRDSCLSFYYHIAGPFTISNLLVYANYSVNGVNHTLHIFNISGDQGRMWWIHQSTLPPGEFAMVFEGYKLDSGYVSLDDIILRTEACKTVYSGKILYHSTCLIHN